MQDGYSQASNLAVEEAAKLKESQQQQSQQQQSQQQGSGDGSGGAGGDSAQQQQQQQQSQQQAPVDTLSEFLKAQGLKSPDELLEKIKPAAQQETEEEKKKREEVERADLNQYAVKEGLMSNDDIVNLEALRKKDDFDLVYDKFFDENYDEIAEEIKEAKPGATEEEINQAVVSEFDRRYPVDHKNDKTKQKAEAAIKKAAAEIRGPLESSFNTAKSKFDSERTLKAEIPKFNSTIESMVSGALPEKFNFFSGKEGETQIDINIDVTAEQRAEISKQLNTMFSQPSVYQLYAAGKKDEIKKMVEDATDLILWRTFGKEGKEKLATVYKGLGVGQGSDTGANESFEMKQQRGGASGGGQKSQSEKEQEVLNSTRKDK